MWHGHGVDFRGANVAAGLAFADYSFDAVMANVSLQMFSDATTRSIVAEVGRVLRGDGLFLFHVNALDELEPNYVLEAAGQTIRLEHRVLQHQGSDAAFEKRVWCVAARKAGGLAG